MNEKSKCFVRFGEKPLVRSTAAYDRCLNARLWKPFSRKKKDTHYSKFFTKNCNFFLQFFQRRQNFHNFH